MALYVIITLAVTIVAVVLMARSHSRLISELDERLAAVDAALDQPVVEQGRMAA